MPRRQKSPSEVAIEAFLEVPTAERPLLLLMLRSIERVGPNLIITHTAKPRRVKTPSTAVPAGAPKS